jgi:hypothetical protein
VRQSRHICAARRVNCDRKSLADAASSKDGGVDKITCRVDHKGQRWVVLVTSETDCVGIEKDNAAADGHPLPIIHLVDAGDLLCECVNRCLYVEVANSIEADLLGAIIPQADAA